jgi:hypothetical protein
MTSPDHSPLDGSIVYNTTIKIDPQIEKQWIEWQKNENLPAVMGTGLFTEYKFFRLLQEDEAEGPTYVIQYFASSIDLYKKYIDEFATLFGERSFAKWGDQFISFHTVMKSVH